MHPPAYKFRNRLLATAVATASLCAAAAAPASADGCAGATADPDRLGPGEAAQVTLCLVNAERTERGLPRLRANAKLALAARRYARTMVDRGFFAHVSPGGSTPLARIKATGYLRGARGWSVGENLAWGTGELATPRSIVSSWMKSPGHRENILRRQYRELGIGVALGTPEDSYEGGGTYVNAFGTRVR